MILFVCYKFELYTGGVFVFIILFFLLGGGGAVFFCGFVLFFGFFWHVSANGKLFRLV